MRKSHWWLAFALVVGFLWLDRKHGDAGLAALGFAGAYWLSLLIHPRTRHGRCNGTGEHRGSVFNWGHRRCGRCQSGRIIRLGASWFGTAPVREEHKRSVAARARARSERTWR